MRRSPSQPVTVTVRPDGSYYVEKRKRAAQPKVQPPSIKLVRMPAPAPAQAVGAQITATLRDFAGIATAVQAVAPKLGTTGTLAALGWGVLKALSTPEPTRAVPFRLRRVRKAP